MLPTIDCRGLTTREINRRVRDAIAKGQLEIKLLHPEARHNLAVALVDPVHVTIEGSVGYYCGGMIDGARIQVRGSAGWGAAESMMGGCVVIDGNAGSGVAASIRGGTVVVRGNAAARAGVSMKGGVLIVGGDCGYMAGFMMQKGTLIICGDAGDALADSMYEGVVYVGGKIAALGNDAVVEDPGRDDLAAIQGLLAEHGVPTRASFKKVVAGRKLWNFDRKELAIWKAAL